MNHETRAAQWKRFLVPALIAIGWALVIPQLVQAFSSARKATTEQSSAAGSAQPAGERVWVVRPDGSQSCGLKEPQSLADGEKALKEAGIATFGSNKGNDGMMHMQMCGASTGGLNGYLIQKQDLPRAIALGFKEAPQGFSK